MQKNVSTLAVLAAITALGLSTVGCSQDELAVQSENQQTSSLHIDSATAIKIASEHVSNAAEIFEGDQWEVNSSVQRAYPVYTPGIEGVSYWECPVKTGKTPAGYVLVCANKSDLIIPETAPEGISPTEQMLNETRSGKDTKSYRYDYIRRALLNGSTSERSGSISVATSIGFESASRSESIEEVAAVHTQLATRNSEMGTFANRDSSLLEAYWTELETDIVRSDWQNQSGELSSTTSYNGTTIRTPLWSQQLNSAGYPSGCGAAAWSIVYGYFHQYHNKKGLFDNQTFAASDFYNRNCSKMSAAQWRLFTLCKTQHGVSNGKKYGRTWPSDMDNGINYAREKGYSTASCNKDNGSEYSKFDNIISQIRANKPAILLIGNDGAGLVDHYIVIEAGRKSQEKYIKKWHDRNVYYTCNWGWGTTNYRKTICTRDWGKNQNDVNPSTSAYLINM